MVRTCRDGTKTNVSMKKRRKANQLAKNQSILGSRFQVLSCFRSVTDEVPQDIPENLNLLFYQNMIKSKPDGDLIENILKYWANDYEKLEYHHGYIQWLFPLKDSGANKKAQVLTDYEINEISGSPDTMGRVVRAYEMMLGFYGFQLADRKTGKLRDTANHIERWNHLNTSRHNCLRITRILKCLQLFNLEQLTYPFLKRLTSLSCSGDRPPLGRCSRSCVNFWIPLISDGEFKKKLLQLVSASASDRHVPT